MVRPLRMKIKNRKRFLPHEVRKMLEGLPGVEENIDRIVLEEGDHRLWITRGQVEEHRIYVFVNTEASFPWHRRMKGSAGVVVFKDRRSLMRWVYLHEYFHQMAWKEGSKCRGHKSRNSIEQRCDAYATRELLVRGEVTADRIEKPMSLEDWMGRKEYPVLVVNNLKVTPVKPKPVTVGDTLYRFFPA